MILVVGIIYKKAEIGEVMPLAKYVELKRRVINKVLFKTFRLKIQFINETFITIGIS